MTDKEYLKKLGDRIKKLRKEKGISQAELANECDIEVPNMSRIESGNTNPTTLTLRKIAQALSLKVKELFGFE